MQKKLVKIWRINLLIFDSKLFPTIMGKVLRESIATFYGLHHKKGKSYTFNHFKKAHLIRRLKLKIPNMDISPIIKMFDNLKQKIHKADKNGLRSLSKM